MPLYEYRCGSCGQDFERLSPREKADAVSCPGCGDAQPRRLLSVIAGMGNRAEPPPRACGQGACAACS